MSCVAVKMPTALTLTVTESVSVSVPPVPTLPRSLVRIWSAAAPVKLLVGMKVAPDNRRLMSVIVPRNRIVASSVPSPTKNVRPVSTGRVTVPLVAVNVTSTVAPPASLSVIEIGLLLAAENTRLVFFGVCWAPGTAFTGASLTAVTVKVTVTGFESGGSVVRLVRERVGAVEANTGKIREATVGSEGQGAVGHPQARMAVSGSPSASVSLARTPDAETLRVVSSSMV